MDLSTGRLSYDQLLQIALDAAAVDDSALLTAVGQRLMSESLGAAGPSRHPGWADADGETLSALTAFVTTAAEVGDLLDSLSADDWTRTTPVEGATVRDIVEHLVGVERYVLGQLDRSPRVEAPRREDHWSLAAMVASDMRGRTDSFAVSTWWSELLEVATASAELGPE